MYINLVVEDDHCQYGVYSYVAIVATSYLYTCMYKVYRMSNYATLYLFILYNVYNV